jgi:stage II sporulation protein M
MHLRLWSMSAKDNLNLYVFIGVLFAVGAIFGALLVNALTLEQQQELADQLSVYMKTVQTPSNLDPASTFWDNFMFYGKWLLLIWLLGLSVIGLPAVLALDFLKGVLIGFAVSMLVRQWAWKGVLFSMATIAPHNALVIPALLIASVSASRFAYFIVRERLFRRKGRLLPPFLAHSGVVAVLLLLVGCASLFEAYVAPLLLEKISPHLVDPKALSAIARF